MNLEMNIKTVIFDLDGTLLNTLNDLHACFNKAIVQYGYPERSLEEIKSFVGNGINKAIERALPCKVEEQQLLEIVNFFRDYYKEHMFELTKPYNGILEILKELKSKNYKLGVVSNKYDAAVKNLCKHYFSEYIDIAIGEGNGIHKKPATDGIYKAIKELNSSIEETIYVGDSDVDILTAQNAQIPCISVLWGFRDKEFLLEHNGNLFAEKPSDIIKIIEKKLYLR